jgi:hypothetical protein
MIMSPPLSVQGINNGVLFPILPQRTQFVRKDRVKKGENEIVIFFLAISFDLTFWPLWCTLLFAHRRIHNANWPIDRLLPAGA